MRPPTFHPIRPALRLAAHAAGAFATGACAALLLAACSPDAGVVGPIGPPLEESTAGQPSEPYDCAEVRRARVTVQEMTGVDPMCVAPDAQPLIWREHFAWRVTSDCGCPLVGS